MHIAITGGGGCIGSYLAAALLKRGARVTVLDNLSLGKKENLKVCFGYRGFRFVETDVRLSDVLADVVKDTDALFHLCGSMPAREKDPLAFLKNNFSATDAVLQAAASARCPVIVASSSYVYGKVKGICSEESDHVLSGESMQHYAFAKALDEYMAYAYEAHHELPTIVVRFFNVLGCRHGKQSGLDVASLFEAALAQEPLAIAGSGDQLFSCMHVEDAVTALLAILDKMEQCSGQVINVASQTRVKMIDFFRGIKALCDSSSNISHVPVQHSPLWGIDYLIPSTQKLYALTGFTETKSVADILRDVYASILVAQAQL